MLPLVRAFRGRRLWIGVAAAVSLSAGLLAVATNANRALRDSGEELRARSHFGFTDVPLDRQARPGFESIGSPAVFRDAAVFQGRLYIAGPAGLLSYDADGRPLDTWRVGEALPPAPLTSLASAADRLWIGTAGEGALVFDGKAFHHIRPELATHRAITAVLPLSTGRVLLGTERAGVLAYDGKTLAPFHESLNGMHITALAGNESSIWVGTIDRGALQWRAGRVDVTGELPDKHVLAISVDGDAAYIGTALGVAEVRDGRVARVLGEGLFARSLLTRSGALLIGTLEDGVYEIPLSTRKPRPNVVGADRLDGAIQKLFTSGTTSYALSSTHLYALGTRGAMTEVLSPDPAVLTDRNIGALAVDPSGRIWTGYFDRGLDIVDANLRSATHIEDEHVFCVNRIVHDGPRSVTAVATANGLALFDGAGRRRQTLGRSDGLIANHVTDVALTPDGMVAATPAGITYLDSGGARSVYAFHGLVNNHVYAIGFARGTLLAGTLGGLSILNTGVAPVNYTTTNSPLKHNWITAVQDTGDGWFVGTYGAGVLRLDASGVWHTSSDLRGQIEINPNAMAATNTRVYAGTLGKGLLIYERGHGRWRYVTAGLPSSNVTAITADSGYIYIGTDNGLVRAREGSL